MQTKRIQTEAGFSLIELIVAMAITLTIASIACTLLAESMKIRTRSNEKIDALADAQRALNIMSREIANAGFNLQGNGIVPEDSILDGNGNNTIRVRANLNKFDTTVLADARNGIGLVGQDVAEDVTYFLYPAGQTNLLARYDKYISAGGTSTVLANRLDSLRIHYFAQRVTYSTDGCDISSPSAGEVVNLLDAKYVVIAVCVQQPAVGTPGSPGYQPLTSVLLVSDVALRNADLVGY